ncbi:hypothetical protein AZI87_07565 [Bdellovibrio bacteriovorus]|uniref:Pilus assembly protein n=1 Tax=Bdellovibrio bacteriovorus TaxID=959 RepID=A0A162GW51_BDEBC|nr:hypothetical protein [Bdellovibrio bacteriovorus]KYG69070.1 hypothetical protein AZI87_07565 [Bdellovibrio bacteriovorus]
MKAFKRILKPVQNESGLISAEFIFALVLCAGMCIILFALNFTLSMAEIAQYIAFSAARAHAASHVDPTKQQQLAKDKYNELVNNPTLKPLFNSSNDGAWFKLGALDVRSGLDGSDFSGDYKYTEDRVPQVGVRFDFQTRILNMKIAFLGSTAEDPERGFSAKVTGLLIREPTQKECWEQQIKPRYTNILNLDSRYKVLGGIGENQYTPMEDNGC